MTNPSNLTWIAGLHSINTAKPSDLYKKGVGVCWWLVLEDIVVTVGSRKPTAIKQGLVLIRETPALKSLKILKQIILCFLNSPISQLYFSQYALGKKKSGLPLTKTVILLQKENLWNPRQVFSCFHQSFNNGNCAGWGIPEQCLASWNLHRNRER